MARAQSRYICQECGTEHRKWAGRCDGCGAWNTITEEVSIRRTGTGAGPRVSAKARALELESLSGKGTALQRRMTGIDEFDRVLGGGLVAGSAILLAGDPGIGKSTLLLQAGAAFCGGAKASPHRVIYVSGEEASDQLRMRAERTGFGDAPVSLLAATNIDDILTTVDGLKPGERPDLLIIDSIQTMHADELDSAPGTVGQVRTSAQALIGYAKRTGITVMMVGHVTKEGQIAGPRVLEHMVDTVLYFEGERGQQFRILRAVKNRFGATDEIGVFEMTDGGLSEVPNPSAMFLGLDSAGEAIDVESVPGAAVFAGMEGTRPVLVEIQALVAPSTLTAPRRAVVGWDSARLAMVIAVLDARCGLGLGSNDVYLSVAGGLRVSEPAADLAVAAALVSSLSAVPAPPATLFFGEIGLSGAVRPVSGRENRLKEAAKLGFTAAVVPRGIAGAKRSAPKGFQVTEIKALSELLALFGLDARPGNRMPGPENIHTYGRGPSGRMGTG